MESDFAVFLIVLVFPSSPRCSSFGFVGLLQCILQIEHADVRAGFRVVVYTRLIAVENGRKWYRNMWWTLQTRLAVAFSEDTDLSDKIQRLRRGCGHATTENALFV